MTQQKLVVVDGKAHQRAVEASVLERGLLPWEDRGDLLELRRQFVRDHAPCSATESALVDQLVWTQWRRRRLFLGERAAHLTSLQERTSAECKADETLQRALITVGGSADTDELSATLVAPEVGDASELSDADEDEAMTRRAIAILETGDPDAYSEALATARSDTASWWGDVVSDDEQTHPDGHPQEGDTYEPYSRTSGSLLRFLKTEVMTTIAKSRQQVLRRPAIRLQAWGESLDPFRLDRILALDERLTRQFEKALSMLIRLQEMRKAPEAQA